MCSRDFFEEFEGDIWQDPEDALLNLCQDLNFQSLHLYRLFHSLFLLMNHFYPPFQEQNFRHFLQTLPMKGIKDQKSNELILNILISTFLSF
jgi:hypothetical protein